MFTNLTRTLNFSKMRLFQTKSCSLSYKITAPPMVYISGEEFTNYASNLYLKEWIEPFIDTSNWEFYDLSCKSRDDTNDQVLDDAIEAGSRIGSIYKEPTITPTETQKQSMGLKNTLRSPNGKMRMGWNGSSISRDTIHIKGMELGYKTPVLFDRHAVGGEYGAGYSVVHAGTLTTTFHPKNNKEKPILVDQRVLEDDINAVVVYHNPYDNIETVAHHFFKRCLHAKVTPYIVTKKTVFKWQEPFWGIMKNTFDIHYKEDFLKAGLLDKCGKELNHLLSDVATMRVVRWSNGGFGMCSHNYDGDVLTDEIAQVHRSPGFLTSVLNGTRKDGTPIKEFEASHGTVADMWEAHLRKEETSLNPLSMIEALIGAMNHSAKLYPDFEEIINFTDKLKKAIHSQMTVKGKATRDLSGPEGLTTEQFVQEIKRRLIKMTDIENNKRIQSHELFDPVNYDENLIKEIFSAIDKDGDGKIEFIDFAKAIKKLGIAPKKADLL